MAHINWKLIIGGFVALGVIPIILLVCMHFLNSVFWVILVMMDGLDFGVAI